MEDEILEIIYEAIKENNMHSKKKIDISYSEKTHLYGEKGSLDSLALVNLIVSIEERVEKKFNKSIVLADEKAFSQKNSPFATIKSLTEYLEKIINE